MNTDSSASASAAALAAPPVSTHYDLVVAYTDKERAIGKDGGIPWPRMKDDMRRFAQVTAGSVVIMGRKTYESLPPRARPLPGRLNIVISTTTRYTGDHIVTAGSFEEALAKAQESRSLHRDQVFVIGGERVYKDALAHPSLRKIIATVLTVHSVPDADASFPPLSTTSRAVHTVDQSDEMEDRGVAYRYVTYALA